MNTFFVLENLETLRKNGRLGRVKALVASALKIKPVMGATPEGTICQLDQARGMNKAIVKMVDHIGEKGINIPEKTVAITHCNCPERAKMPSKDRSYGYCRCQQYVCQRWWRYRSSLIRENLQFRKLSHFFRELPLFF